MKVLILGAKGMLGSALANEFTGKHEVVALDHDQVDISSPESLASSITSDIDVIINAAAWNDIDAAEGDLDRAMKTNAQPLAVLADVANIMNMTLVHFSSEHVFSGKESRGYKENDRTEPLSVFGQAKVQSEKFALDNDRTYLVRTSRLFGDPGTSPDAKKSFIEKIRNLAAAQGSLDSVHDEVASPTYVKDLAGAVRELVETKKPYGIYHVTNGGIATWYQWANKIVELSGLKAAVNPVARREMPSAAPRPRYGMLLNTKLPQLRNWDEALQEYLKAS